MVVVTSLPSPRDSFIRRKTRILSQLAVPEEEYTDASPKGSIDAGIRSLIDEINAQPGLVTTSSCAGRASVYLEGRKKKQAASWSPGNSAAATADDEVGEERIMSPAVASSSGGGKGGGEWLFVSHDPFLSSSAAAKNDDDKEKYYYESLLLGLGSGERDAASSASPSTTAAAEAASVQHEDVRLIHFKFEPMILHILTASHEHAQLVIQAGIEAGFRETGAVSLLGRGEEEGWPTPIVAVRCMGLSFESLIGVVEADDDQRRAIVTPSYLNMLVQIADERFVENQKRIARFQAALQTAFAPPVSKEHNGWEDGQARRERKREEGLRRREQLKGEESGRKKTVLDLKDLILQEPDVL